VKLTSGTPRGWNPWRRTPQDLDVIEGGRETVKGRELGRDRLRQATKLPMAKDLGRLVRLVKARSTRRSARGGQNLSARRGR
jgi:hypothetical protein